MFLFRLRVRGHSMEPTIKNNSFVLASSIPYVFRQPQVGDIIVFKKEGKLIIKRISSLKKEGYLLSGDNKKDSKDFGLIKKTDIVGKIIRR